MSDPFKEALDDSADELLRISGERPHEDPTQLILMLVLKELVELNNTVKELQHGLDRCTCKAATVRT